MVQRLPRLRPMPLVLRRLRHQQVRPLPFQTNTRNPKLPPRLSQLQLRLRIPTGSKTLTHPHPDSLPLCLVVSRMPAMHIPGHFQPQGRTQRGPHCHIYPRIQRRDKHLSTLHGLHQYQLLTQPVLILNTKALMCMEIGLRSRQGLSCLRLKDQDVGTRRRQQLHSPRSIGLDNLRRT